MTTVTDHRQIFDANMLQIYKDQKVVEIGFQWLKGPLEVSLIFLKEPEQIQALGFIFLLALLVGALIQRDLRKSLRKRGGTGAYFGGKRTDAPTWNSALALFDGIRATWVRVGDAWHRTLHHFNSIHQIILDLLGLPQIHSRTSNLCKSRTRENGYIPDAWVPLPSKVLQKGLFVSLSRLHA